jgi:hypothetical protein
VRTVLFFRSSHLDPPLDYPRRSPKAGHLSRCNRIAPTPRSYAAGHNPYLRQPLFFTPPKKENPLTYLGGGRDFGQIGPITNDTVPPHIVSRNLTPDNSGLPEQGATFVEFFNASPGHACP